MTTITTTPVPCGFCGDPVVPGFAHVAFNCIRVARQRGDFPPRYGEEGYIEERSEPVPHREPGAEYAALIRYREPDFMLPTTRLRDAVKEALEHERGAILGYARRVLDKSHSGHASCNSAGMSGADCKIGICVAIRGIIEFVEERNK